MDAGTAAVLTLLGFGCVVVFVALTIEVSVAEAASPNEHAECRRDRGVPIDTRGIVVCLASTAVLWESDRRP